MAEADSYCPGVVIQVASVTRALQEAAVGLLTDRLRRCVTQAAQRSPGEGDQALIEAAGAIRQVVRL
jgi:DNA-binding FrmR family transcriptional regulator